MHLLFKKHIFAALQKKWLSLTPDKIKIPSIVKAELLTGAYKSKAKESTLKKLESFLTPYEIVPFGNQTAHYYAAIRADLEKHGTPIGPNDALND